MKIYTKVILLPFFVLLLSALIYFLFVNSKPVAYSKKNVTEFPLVETSVLKKDNYATNINSFGEVISTKSIDIKYPKNGKIFEVGNVSNGSFIKKGSVAAIIQGDSKSVLTGERTALNFISHISGIATKTNLFVKASKTKNCKICCTRKTIPNLRSIQKYAVKLGGGFNHRFNLSDEY